MESLKELWVRDAGLFALGASMRCMAGEFHPPRPTGVLSADTEEHNHTTYTRLLGPDAVCDHQAWLNHAEARFPYMDIPDRVDWFITSGLRGELVSGLQRLEHSFVRGVNDVVAPRLPAVALQRKEYILHGPGILAFDLSLALEFLLAGLVLGRIDRSTFWSGVERVAEKAETSFSGWGDYLRSFHEGFLVFMDVFGFDREKVVLNPHMELHALSPVPWVSPRLKASIPDTRKRDENPLSEENQRYVCGLRLKSETRPGPIWLKSYRGHVLRRLLMTWRTAALGFVTSLTGMVVIVSFPSMEALIFLGGWLLLLAPLGRPLYRNVRAYRSVTSKNRLRVAVGAFTPASTGAPNSVAFERARELPVPTWGEHTMLLSPDEDTVISVDGIFLSAPVPVASIPTVFTPKRIHEPRIPPGAVEAMPTSRDLDTQEREHLKGLVQAEKALRKALLTRVVELSILAFFLVIVLGLSSLWAALIPLAFAAALVAPNVLSFLQSGFRLRALLDDLRESRVNIVYFAEPSHQDMFSATPYVSAEILPHSARCWRFMGATHMWRR